MPNPIKWIEQQRDKAQQDLEEAQKRVETWTEALKLAKADQERARQEQPPPVPKKREKVSILKLAEEAIRETGPLTSFQIKQYLDQRGAHTTVNSVNVSLSRKRPERFDKDEEYRWFLVPLQKGRPEQPEPFK